MAARTIASGTADVDEDEGGAGGWGDDADLVLDDEEKPARRADDEAASEGDEEGGWEVDEDLELPPDVAPVASGADEDVGYYVAPTRGQPPAQGWAAHSQLVADHAAAGSFATAFRLLNDQIGVVNFAPLK